MRSGRYQASYIAPDGQRYNGPHTFSAKVDADGWLASQHAALVAGTWTTSTPLSSAVISARAEKELVDQLSEEPVFEEYAQQDVSKRRKDAQPLAARTQAEYYGYIRNHLKDFHGRKLSTITKEDIDEWFEAFRRTGKITMLERVYTYLKGMFDAAVADENLPLVTKNPCQVKDGTSLATKARVSQTKSRLVDDEELQKMVAAVDDRFRAAVLIGAWVGLRSGELRELRRKDVLITNEKGDQRITFYVRRGVTRVTKALAEEIDRGAGLRTGQELGEDGYVVGPTKSMAGARVVAMPRSANAAIIHHLDTYVRPGPESLLFPSLTNPDYHLAPSTFYDFWYPAREAAGRPDVAFHDLRHHAATQYARAGATLKELMVRVGHSTHHAAFIYQQISQNREAELLDKMDAANQPAPVPDTTPKPKKSKKKKSKSGSDTAALERQLAEMRAMLEQAVGVNANKGTRE